MNLLIIDDENRARLLLKTILLDYCPQVHSIYEAEDLLKGIEIIKKHKPEIVFLDIEMPKHSGIEILNFIDKDEMNFEIIFTTAYSEYAIQAFQLSAIDYLLKPLSIERVQEALQKHQRITKKREMRNRLKHLSDIHKTLSFNKVALPVGDSIHFLELKDIIYFKADSMYTKVHTISKGELLISKPLKYFEKLMQSKQAFYRPHRSFLVNVNQIKQFVKKDGAYIIMKNDVNISISKDKKEEFLQLLST